MVVRMYGDKERWKYVHEYRKRKADPNKKRGWLTAYCREIGISSSALISWHKMLEAREKPKYTEEDIGFAVQCKRWGLSYNEIQLLTGIACNDLPGILEARVPELMGTRGQHKYNRLRIIRAILQADSVLQQRLQERLEDVKI